MVTLSGCELERLLDAARQFSSVSPSMPAMRSMLICGKPSDRANVVGAEDLRRPVRAPVELEDLVVEVLDAQAETRDADAANGGQLGLGQRARLALERDFLRVAPRASRRVSRPTRPSSCRVERNDGVPPPK